MLSMSAALPPARSAGRGARSAAPVGDQQVLCWACGCVQEFEGRRRARLPCVSCGALQKPADRLPELKTSRPVRMSFSRRLPGLLFAACVFAVTLGYDFIAVKWLLPWILDILEASSAARALHGALATFLSCEVVVTYLVVVFGDPGRTFAQGTTVAALRQQGLMARAAAQGRLAGYSLCARCALPKSATAHHCRRCGICVEGVSAFGQLILGCAHARVQHAAQALPRLTVG